MSCKSLLRPPSTGIIKLTGLTLLGAGTGEDFGADTAEDIDEDFGVDTGEEASEDFGADVGEDVGKDFDADAGGDSCADGGGGVDRDMGGSRSLHAPSAGGEGNL